LQLKVTLVDSRPPIWRRLQVSEETRLPDLHMTLQIAMGWTNSHLHSFEVGERRLTAVDEFVFFSGNEDSTDVKLKNLHLRKGQKIKYVYDFGDHWLHSILVEDVLPVSPDHELPICLKGRRACPPEDCGGIYGYEELLAVLADPKDPRHKEMLEWIGGSFEPEAFDITEVNKRLRKAVKSA
jgi:hypothetical protein